MLLRFEQLVPLARERLFAFHSNPANLAVLLEGWPGFELLAHDRSIMPGSRVKVLQRVGWWQHEMLFEHFLHEPPRRFGERQIRGPFARFEHVHEFLETEGGTTIVDRLDFALPRRRGGWLAERCIAALLLRRFFEFRCSAYRRLVDGGALR